MAIYLAEPELPQRPPRDWSLLHFPSGTVIPRCPFCAWVGLVVNDDMGRGHDKAWEALEDHAVYAHPREE